MFKNFSPTVAVFFLAIHSWAVPFEAERVILTGPSPYAVETGKKVFKAGGNVVDIAVAMGLTLSVTSPYFASLGGGGFAMIKVGPHEVEALDFREIAPLATGPEFYMARDPKSSKDGGAAVGVPGFPAGLWEMHKKYGKLKWKTLFTDAINLAEKGFQISGEWSRSTRSNKERFNPSGIKYFFGKAGAAYVPGQTLKQPQLAKALRFLRDRGKTGFYSGPVAQDLIKTVKSNEGVITKEDLANYKVRWLKPMVTPFRGHQLYLMPPPSSGGVVLATAAGITEKIELDKRSFMSVDELHLLGEIFSRSYRGRTLLADPNFHKNPIAQLTSEAYISEMAQSIDPKKARRLGPIVPNELKEPKESGETTHYSVLDAAGNAVALTVTLNGSYGSGVVSEKYGIALNNEMDDFTTIPGQANMYGLVQGLANKVEPGKRPLSSMSPTLVAKDGQIVMTVGAPGGPRIISSVFQVLYRTLVNGLDIDQAIQSPRVHHQYEPNTLYVDTQKHSPDVLESLRARGHTVEESWSAKVKALRKNSLGWLEGSHDSRGEGATGGF